MSEEVITAEFILTKEGAFYIELEAALEFALKFIPEEKQADYELALRRAANGWKKSV
jgi:hypothetical protein